MKTDADGNFELYIGGEKRADNWLPTTPGSRKLFIREAFDAWFETPTTLSIERIGMDSPRPIPDAGADDRGDGLGRGIPHRRDARLAGTFLELLGRRVRSGVRQPVPARQDPPTPTPTPSAAGWRRTWSGSWSPTRR